VQDVQIGYEQYGLLDDIHWFEQTMRNEKGHFQIKELKTPETGGHSKRDRIERLEPDIRGGRFLFPCEIYHAEFGGPQYWEPSTKELEALAAEQGTKHNNAIGEIVYRAKKGPTKLQMAMERSYQKYRIAPSLWHRDENGDIYDLTRVFIEEAIRHPFGRHDDLIDATARIYDIDPYPPVRYERQSTEPLGLDEEDLRCESLEARLELEAELDDS
jgi:hypothetical protein